MGGQSHPFRLARSRSRPRLTPSEPAEPAAGHIAMVWRTSDPRDQAFRRLAEPLVKERPATRHSPETAPL
jgi:hypothetical protein